MTAHDKLRLVQAARDRNNRLWMELAEMAGESDAGRGVLHRIAGLDQEIRGVAILLSERNMTRVRRLHLIAELGRLRVVNNACWMDLVQMAFDRDPVRSAELMGRIAGNDAQVAENMPPGAA